MTEQRIAAAIEGGDGVGKNTLQMAIVDLLLQLDRHVLITNFPQYWYFGSYVRKMLTSQFKQHLAGLSPQEEFRLRGSIFALDRAVCLNYMLPHLDQDPELCVISDRGPWSNLVTAAYLNSTFAEAEIDAESVMNFMNQTEQEMLVALNSNALLCVQDGQNGHGAFQERVLQDDYERSEVQVEVDRLYNQAFPQDRRVVTRDQNGWRDLELSSKQALGIIGVPNSELDQVSLSQDRLTFLQDAYQTGSLHILGPRDFLNSNNMYCHPELRELISEWEILTLGSDEQIHERFGQDKPKKDYLTEVEAEIADVLIEKTSQLLLPATVVHPTASRAILRIIDNNPQIPEIILGADDLHGPAMLNYLNHLAGLSES